MKLTKIGKRVLLALTDDENDTWNEITNSYGTQFFEDFITKFIEQRKCQLHSNLLDEVGKIHTRKELCSIIDKKKKLIDKIGIK